MEAIKWTATVDLGTVIQTMIFIGGIIAIFVRTEANVAELKSEVHEIQKEIRIVADVITKLAVQSERLDNYGQRMNRVEQAVDDLRRGRGFIVESAD